MRTVHAYVYEAPEADTLADDPTEPRKRSALVAETLLAIGSSCTTGGDKSEVLTFTPILASRSPLRSKSWNTYHALGRREPAGTMY
eukprot:2765196-Prymnesium_polylepis.2